MPGFRSQENHIRDLRPDTTIMTIILMTIIIMTTIARGITI